MGGPDAVKAAEAGGQADRPTRSDPRAKSPSLAAVAAAEPLLEPPGMRTGTALLMGVRNARSDRRGSRRSRPCASCLPSWRRHPANAGRRWPSWSERDARPASPGCLLRSASRQRRTDPSRQSATRPAARRLGSGVRPDHAHRTRRPTPAWSIRAATGRRPAVRTSGGRACSRKAEMPARLRPERWSCSQARQRPPPSRAPVRNRRAAGA